MAVSRSIWYAVRRAWRRGQAPTPSASDIALAVHANAPVDPEPLSEHEQRALADWRRAPRETVSAAEAKRRLLTEDEAGGAGAR